MPLPLIMAWAVWAGVAAAGEHRASSAREIARLTPVLRPGDTVVLADGLWKDQPITLDAAGTNGKPITFRAQTPGKVILTGKSSVTVAGKHLVVSGLYLK